MKSVCMFNNKGGVGKTTLTCNVASLLARRRLRVLVVDCDPQCNSTQLILGEDECTKAYYDETEARSFRTILDVVKPLLDGDAGVATGITILSAVTNRFGVDLLPGHPKFSLVEDVLSEAWGNVRGGDLGGLRKTNWFHAFLGSLQSTYDVVFVDVGPSLGSINRSLLLGADGFVAPMGSDVFSLIGIRNVAEWLRGWSVAYERGVEALKSDRRGAQGQHPIKSTAGVKKGFFGYAVQQYIAKTVQGERRPTQAYEKIVSKVPIEIENALAEFFSAGVHSDNMGLGDVPNMFSLVPMAQSASAPIHDLQSSDGIRGAQYSQQASYVEQLKVLAGNLASNIGIG
ncbi:MAG: ParA family protein [Planctomycetota bacterium]